MTVTLSTTSEANISGINVSFFVLLAKLICFLFAVPSNLCSTANQVCSPPYPVLADVVSKKEASKTNVTGESCLGCAANSLFLYVCVLSRRQTACYTADRSSATFGMKLNLN